MSAVIGVYDKIEMGCGNDDVIAEHVEYYLVAAALRIAGHSGAARFTEEVFGVVDVHGFENPTLSIYSNGERLTVDLRSALERVALVPNRGGLQAFEDALLNPRVRCNNCMHVMTEAAVPLKVVDGSNVEYCSTCGRSDCLMDINASVEFLQSLNATAAA